MRKTFLFAAAGVGLMVAPVSHDAQAFTPLGGTPVAPSDVTTVAGGCGFGWHRGPGADAAVITVRPGAVSGAAVGASAAGRRWSASFEPECKVKVEECPARVPQRGTRDPSIDGGIGARIGSGRRVRPRFHLRLCLRVRAALVPCGCGIAHS
jgi:hypothetical protein